MASGLNRFKNPLMRCASRFSALLIAFSVSFLPSLLSAQQNFQWRNFTRIKDGLGSNNVRSIANGRMGGIWLATSAGLSYFDGFWQNYDVPGGDVSQVFEDRDEFIWATTDTGIHRGIFKRSVNQIDWHDHYSTNNGLIDNRVLTAIQRSADEATGNEGEIWIGTPNRG